MADFQRKFKICETHNNLAILICPACLPELVDAVADRWPVEIAEVAKARGRALDLWETAVELLAELEEMGWGSTDQEVDIAETDASG